ncbi:MAG: hypothetical protein EOO46_23600 [Flavobacterium sp.]|nr:MAG: hypothetical protein EOO46_23600 [Flavobacterium sp.]
MQREIRQKEKDLIAYLLEQLPANSNQYRIPLQVTELQDGGMGSIRLTDKGRHHKDLIQLQYVDVDGQMVIITLTESHAGELFELDIWNVNFSALKQYPTVEELKPFS